MTALLTQARRLLDESTRGTISSWPRAVALLARQELEDSLDAYWEKNEAELRWANMRTQLGCLRVYAGDERFAAEVGWLWHSLSRVTHHHPYELDPTREELASLVARTEAVSSELRPTPPPNN